MPSGRDKRVWDNKRLVDPHRQFDKAARVRAMFDEIAPSYERVNRLLSAGRDGFWRRRAVELADVGPADRVLDLACGTGDFARALAAAGPALVVGCDFAERMLRRAVARPTDGVRWARADALRLPFADEAFTVISVAFGVRNWQDLQRGLEEMHRALRPGGRVVILEFSTPRAPLVGAVYRFYFRNVLPRVATWISGDRSGAYRYLPASVSSFMEGEAMITALRDAGFDGAVCHRLTLGIVTVYLAHKSS